MSGKAIFDNLHGSTSCWTASVRAVESKREDRLLIDPWVAALAGEQV
jgi:O-methyltransferase involved in polyketide biosynthesis